MGSVVDAVIGAIGYVIGTIVDFIGSIIGVDLGVTDSLMALLGFTEENMDLTHITHNRCFDDPDNYYTSSRTKSLIYYLKNDGDPIRYLEGMGRYGANLYDKFRIYGANIYVDYLPDMQLAGTSITSSNIKKYLATVTSDTISNYTFNMGYPAIDFWCEYQLQEGNLANVSSLPSDYSYDTGSNILLYNKKYYKRTDSYYTSSNDTYNSTFTALTSTTTTTITDTKISVENKDDTTDIVTTTITITTILYSSGGIALNTSKTINTSTEEVTKDSISASTTIDESSNESTYDEETIKLTVISPLGRYAYGGYTTNKDSKYYAYDITTDSMKLFSNSVKVSKNIEALPIITLRNQNVNIDDYKNNGSEIITEYRYKSTADVLNLIGINVDDLLTNISNAGDLSSLRDVFIGFFIDPSQSAEIVSKALFTMMNWMATKIPTSNDVNSSTTYSYYVKEQAFNTAVKYQLYAYTEDEPSNSTKAEYTHSITRSKYTYKYTFKIYFDIDGYNITARFRVLEETLDSNGNHISTSIHNPNDDLRSYFHTVSYKDNEGNIQEEEVKTTVNYGSDIAYLMQKNALSDFKIVSGTSVFNSFLSSLLSRMSSACSEETKSTDSEGSSYSYYKLRGSTYSTTIPSSIYDEVVEKLSNGITTTPSELSTLTSLYTDDTLAYYDRFNTYRSDLVVSGLQGTTRKYIVMTGFSGATIIRGHDNKGFACKTTISGQSDDYDVDDEYVENVLFPVTSNLLSELSVNDKMKLFPYTLYMISYISKHIHLEWYETEKWANAVSTFMYIFSIGVIIVMSVITFGFTTAALIVALVAIACTFALKIIADSNLAPGLKVALSVVVIAIQTIVTLGVSTAANVAIDVVNVSLSCFFECLNMVSLYQNSMMQLEMKDIQEDFQTRLEDIQEDIDEAKKLRKELAEGINAGDLVSLSTDSTDEVNASADLMPFSRFYELCIRQPFNLEFTLSGQLNYGVADYVPRQLDLSLG